MQETAPGKARMRPVRFEHQLMGEPQGYNYKELIYRVGTFFLLVGTGLLIFFMLSEAADQPMFSYFCWSMILLVVGFLFRAQYKKTVAPSGRFSILRRLRPKPKEEQKK
jgi:hypothetical protein